MPMKWLESGILHVIFNDHFTFIFISSNTINWSYFLLQTIDSFEARSTNRTNCGEKLSVLWKRKKINKANDKYRSREVERKKELP